MSGLEINWLVVAIRVFDGWLYGTGFVLALLIWFGIINTANKHSDKKKEAKLNAKATSNTIESPSHYTHGEIECIDGIRAALGREGFIAFLRGQVIRYQWRIGHKENDAQDAGKARWYAAKLEEVLKEPAC